MSARFDNVMFASLQPSDFLRSVCLHWREMSMIHMCPLKAAGLSFNFGMVIQVVMSVGQVENAEVRKPKYGNGSTEVRRKAAYQQY